MIDFTLTNLDKTLEEFMADEKLYTFPGLSDWIFPPDIDDFQNLGDPPIVQNQDKQAFDIQDKAIQEIGDIAARSIREGGNGHRLALHKIMQICRAIE